MLLIHRVWSRSLLLTVASLTFGLLLSGVGAGGPQPRDLVNQPAGAFCNAGIKRVTFPPNQNTCAHR